MDKILALSALCNFYSCYMKNVLVFSQSDAHDFLMYIIRSVMRMFVLKCMFDLFFFYLSYIQGVDSITALGPAEEAFVLMQI